MRNYLTIGGTDSKTYGVYISGKGTFSAPQRAYNMIAVPGRNGDLVGIENRFVNYDVTYPAFIYLNFSSNIEGFRNLLLSKFGYFRLEDSYHPNEFRQAVYVGPFTPRVQTNNLVGEFDLVFNCKPQRYLKSGETQIHGTKISGTTKNITVSNPTLFPSQPLLRIYGAGTITIGSQTVTISQADGYTDIDCEMMDCFKGSVNKNSYVSFSDYKFPTLQSGNTSITFGTGITEWYITPRWWIL